jgi:sulfate permease, SulP family
VVVGIVALPLSMALAVASGVPPQHGLYTAIIAGALVALLGGSKVQVTGPTAAFVVILAPIAARHGVGGLLLATMMAGIIMLLMGVARLGRLIEFIPAPVTTGFTAGIAVVIATMQLKDFLGLESHAADSYFERVALLIAAARHADWSAIWPNAAIGVMTLLILKLWPAKLRIIPSPLVALPVAALAAAALVHANPDWQIATIASRFSGGIPRVPPTPALPWLLAGPGGAPLDLSLGLIQALLGSAFAIAILGAIESLLSAVIADGMTGKRHNPDAELLAQGLGNIVAPFFGGIAATGAIARTATNIRSGARSPIAAIVHALFVLAAMLLLAPALGYLPMAALAGLLLVVAWNMAEVKHFAHMAKLGPVSDVLVLLTCFLLTVIFDMVIAVSAGVVLAALLFMGRMADLTGAKIIEEGHPEMPEALPRGVLLYRVAGPLFFGAAQRAMSALGAVGQHVRMVILDLTAVPVMDATGLINLEGTLDRLHAQRTFVVVAGVQDQPLKLMAKARWKHREWLVIWRSLDEAIHFARTLDESDFAPLARPHSTPATTGEH